MRVDVIRPFDLNLRHLRALPIIAEIGSLSAAADVVGLSQPALAQGLAKLEAQFGAALFDRRPNGMRATEAGAKVIERVRDAQLRMARAMPSSDRGARRAPQGREKLLTAAQVRGLLSLAEAGSFAGAARLTGISQPSIHRSVRELEALCGTVLADRQGRSIVLTPKGRAMVRQFRLAAADLQAALEEAGTGRCGSRLSIGAMPLCRAHLLPQAVAQIYRESASTQVDIVEGSFTELSELLRDGRIDLMIGALRDPCPAEFAQLPLFADRLTVAARSGHPLTALSTVSASQLADYPWIVGRKGSPLRGHWERMFERAGLGYPRAPIECGSVLAIRGILIETDFLTLLSPDQIALELGCGLLARVEAEIPPHTRSIGAITRSDWHPTRLQRQFLAILTGISEAQYSGN